MSGGNTTALIIEDAQREARKSFRKFVGYTMPEYEFGWFNELLCMVLQDTYERLDRGEFPRVMIFAPPRSGKSELASRRFPAWAFGMNNKIKTIACSYSSDLAKRMSRDSQRIMDDPCYHDIFPDSNLNSVNVRTVTGSAIRTAEMWEIISKDGHVTGGSYRASGVGGGINGMGFELGIIDDPVKSYKEASSKTQQQTIWDWYRSTFYTRRNPKKNAIILIMTRWHKNDLAGMLLDEMENGGDKWTLVNFPMQAEERESFTFGEKTYKTRNVDDILFPERMPMNFVEQCKRSGDLTWSALYQQRPNIAGGNYFKSTYFNHYDDLPKFERMIITGDTAQKTKDANDFSVFQCWGLLKRNIYLVDMIRGKWEAHNLKIEAWKFWDKWGGGIVGAKVQASAMYVEDKVSGTGLIQEMRAGGYDADGVHHNPVPVIPIPRGIDKVTRAIDAQPTIQSGFLYLPANAPWLSAYLMEFEDFSLEMTHAHDDQIDPTLDAIDILIKCAGGVSYNGNW